MEKLFLMVLRTKLKYSKKPNADVKSLQEGSNFIKREFKSFHSEQNGETKKVTKTEYLRFP